ncbi:hypothetical protein HGRIS_010441 [Hohenbuehelia grisea]|uniref:Uncharacterized protein n=1 Tax=Hohenbuehelia grisea TaxID=104357 RepID=A0ABR3IZ42_9AGAR
MSTADLPLKVRADIRDLWDKKDSSINQAVDTLNKTLGHKITPAVEWVAIWAECQDLHPEKSTFVPTIVNIVQAWYATLVARLDDDNEMDWTENLLTTLADLASHGVKLLVEARGKSISQPETRWLSRERCFTLGVPITRSVAIHSLKHTFNANFASIFEPEDEPGLASNIAAHHSNNSARDDDWSEITSNNDILSVVSGLAPAASAAPKRPFVSSMGPDIRAAPNVTPERLPSVNTIPRPQDHFQATTPYTLLLDYTRGEQQMLQIFSSHQKSLQLLADYFSRWGTKNFKDSRYPTILNIQLRDSTLCSGVNDTLVIRPYYTKEFEVNPALAISFIEGTLGYQLVHTNGTNWVYKCERQLLWPHQLSRDPYVQY